MVVLIFSGDDFTINSIVITIPAGRTFFYVEPFFNVTADNIDEIKQSFAVVAEIGQDVPNNVSCFQIVDGQDGCTTERHGAIRINIIDRIVRFWLIKPEKLLFVVYRDGDRIYLSKSDCE